MSVIKDGNMFACNYFDGPSRIMLPDKNEVIASNKSLCSVFSKSEILLKMPIFLSFLDKYFNKTLYEQRFNTFHTLSMLQES